MGNSITYYNICYKSLDEETIKYIRNKYYVIDVDWLDRTLVNSKMFNNEYFEFSSKKESVNKMLDYYLNDKDKIIYKKTDYLCNEREKICICNTHANDFRKIYNGINYKPNKKYISWCKKDIERF
jgi:hypothetical protein